MATNQPSPFNDPSRAADELEPLPVAKASLRRIADGYDRLAARLAERLTTK